MSWVRKFLRLSAAERWLLLRVVFLLGVVRLALKLFPLRLLHRLLSQGSGSSRRAPAPDDPYPAQVAWAVHLAGRHILGDKACLTQALVGRFLLSRRGYPAELRIGVARAADGTLTAHAWVESGGSVLIGGPEAAVRRYTPLPRLDEAIT